MPLLTPTIIWRRIRKSVRFVSFCLLGALPGGHPGAGPGLLCQLVRSRSLCTCRAELPKGPTTCLKPEQARVRRASVLALLTPRLVPQVCVHQVLAPACATALQAILLGYTTKRPVILQV
jgi:hypothetical protein